MGHAPRDGGPGHRAHRCRPRLVDAALSVRFRPPPAPIGEDVRWALARAFARPGSGGAAGPGDPAAAVQIAAGLGLAARIAARVPLGALARELGREAALWLWSRGAPAEAHGRTLAAWLGRIADAASAARLPLAPLKFAALHLRGLVRPGERPAADLDLLAPAGREQECARLLESLGLECKADEGAPASHQLPRFAADRATVEVHRWVPGIRTPGRPGFATLEDLQAAGLLEARQAWLCPTVPLLAAHAIVHGVAQHGFAPDTYPLMRMVADVADLGIEEDAARRDVLPWIAADVAADECAGVARLARRLAAGDLGVLEEREAPEAVLVRHVLSSLRDRRYQRSLRLRYYLNPLAPGARSAGVARGLLSLAFPDDAELHRIYGARGRWATLGLRLARPLRLAASWLQR